MPGRLKALLRGAGVDRAVAYGALARGSSALLSLLGMALIAWRFPPELQGYHFTFLNLLQLQAFAELGLLSVLIQFASHEWARLRLAPDGSVEGEADALSRFVALGRFAARWFFIAGAAVAAVVGAAGGLFFAKSGAPGVAWAAPWIVLCVLTGLKMWTFPAVGLLEGSGQVAEVYFLRWTAALAFGLAFAAGVAGGLGLWSVVAGLGAETAWTAIRLAWAHRRFLASFAAPRPGPRISWTRELLPMQSRVALSWMSGYFAFSIFTPLLFRFEGPAAAGRWGMTWSALAVVASVAGLWIGTRAPRFGVWIANRDFASLDAAFRRLLFISTALAAAGAGAVWAGTWLLHRAGHAWAARTLDLESTALLALATTLLQVSQGLSVYLRAHRREPFVWISVAQAVVTAGGAVLLGAAGGARGMAAAYLAGVVLVVPLSALIWSRCRRDWHAAEGAA